MLLLNCLHIGWLLLLDLPVFDLHWVLLLLGIRGNVVSGLLLLELGVREVHEYRVVLREGHLVVLAFLLNHLRRNHVA